MDSPVHRYAFVGLICLICLVGTVPVWASPQGSIVGVRVSQDAKHIVIEHEGVGNRYSAFAIGHPNRLVIDFKETALLNVPHKIRVGRNSIQEIRLGYSGTRSRVVVDFGESSVPPYRLHPESRRLVLVLGKALHGIPSSPVRIKKPAPVPIQALRQLKARTAKPPAPTGDQPKLSIRSAEVKDDRIVIELAERAHPKRSCRLVLEVDMDRMKVRKATIDGDKGNPRISELKNYRRDAKTSSPPSTSRRGPRREAPEVDSPPPTTPGYRWGQPSVAVKHRGPASKSGPHAGPLRLEPLTLKKRPASNEG